MKTARFLCFVALAGVLSGQTLEVTSKLHIKFYSLPDPKAGVAEARKNLASDPQNPELRRLLSKPSPTLSNSSHRKTRKHGSDSPPAVYGKS